MPEDDLIRADIMALVRMRLQIMGTEATPSTKVWLDRTYQGLGEAIQGLEGLETALEGEPEREKTD